ncbi:hypothetical protein GH714_021013 [Hevea brasiliensis]|uniref:Uncharacterized protein n=1 Tax=Hevea brasiliensis TaxID=3981 RepID=A0A6A6N3E9_HEVBR|nr:hypothetical protein GH714_021013 [Hevea brasiliensis]
MDEKLVHFYSAEVVLQVTLIAQGDVPLSIIMTVCTTLGAVLLTPMLTKILAGTYVPVDALKLSISTLQVVVAPILLGSYLQSKFPAAVKAVIPFAPLFAVGFITACMQVGMQNSSLGVVLATSHFTSPMVALPPAMSAVIMNIMGSSLGFIWRYIDPSKLDDSPKLTGKDESKLVEEIVNDALKKLSHMSSGDDYYDDNLIGIESRVEEVEKLLNDKRVVGIWRMGAPGNLKLMDLSCSEDLIRIPDLSSTAPNLEFLYLCSCRSLVEIPSSLQYLSKLTELHLQDSKQISIFQS